MSLPHSFILMGNVGYTSTAAGYSYDWPGSFTFLSIDSSGNHREGAIGPNRSDLLASSTYAASTTNTWLNDTANFDVTPTGIQVWTVPADGTYRFLAKGPNHLLNTRNGAVIEVDAPLLAGEKVYICVGQRSGQTNENTSEPGSGGTFVVKVPSSYLGNTTAGLAQCQLTDIICVAGGAGYENNAYAHNNHPTGSQFEVFSSGRYGAGRSTETYGNGGGPSGAAGFSFNSNDSSSDLTGTYDGGRVYFSEAEVTNYTNSGSFTNATYAKAFKGGATGGRGHQSSDELQATYGNHGARYGDGGFGGGGAQSAGNSFNAGAGGMIGGWEGPGSTVYPAEVGVSHKGGGSYIGSIVTNTVQNAVSNSGPGSVLVTKIS